MSRECNAVSAAEAQGNEGSPAVFRAYIETDDGVPLVQADVSSIALKVFAPTDVTASYEIDSIAASSAVFDTLQTWIGHVNGYNFKHTVPGAAFPDGNINYRGEYKITLTSGNILWAVFQNATMDIRSD